MQMPKTRMGIFHLLKEAIRKDDLLKKYQMPFVIAAETAGEIQCLMELLKDEDIQLTIVDGFEFGDAIEELKEKKVGIIFGNFSNLSQIELSQDSRLNFTMDDKQNGVNHLVVTGKGELQERNIFHLYVQKDGSIGKTQYYKGLNEISAVYENTSTETAELEKTSVEQLQKLMNKKTFQMDVAKLGIEVGIGDIVGGRDYLTGMYMSKPIENIIYEITNGGLQTNIRMTTIRLHRKHGKL